MREEVSIHPENSLVSFHSLVAAVRRSPYKLYLFIDEDDNFANEVMMGGQGENHKRYNDLIQGEGLFKTLFKNIKSAGSGEGLDRVFMTGVSPIVMIDPIKEQMEVAKQQLQHYQQVLVQKYGNILKLRTFAIVSVGVERLIWEEVS